MTGWAYQISAALVLPLTLLSSMPGDVMAGSAPPFTSARPLLLRSSALPPHYRYHGFFVQDNVENWDGGIRPLIQIDEGNGWIEGAEERVTDPKGGAAMLSVQLFRTAAGARADFRQFFTNAHPETVYEPGSSWLGGTSVGGLGDLATIYREEAAGSRCPQRLTSGLSFVYRNGIFSARVCLKTVGEAGVRVLAARLLHRAQSVSH